MRGGAGDDRLARRLRRAGHRRARSAPIYIGTSSRTAASRAGCSARWSLFVIVLSFSQVRRPAHRARLRPDGQHRRQRSVVGPHRDLGQPARRRCSSHPITFITGFGWDVYWSFPFRFSPHNHYFALWFNLGLVGLFTGAYLTVLGHRPRASRESRGGTPPLRRHLIAFVIGGIGAVRRRVLRRICTNPGSISGCTPASSCGSPCARRKDRCPCLYQTGAPSGARFHAMPMAGSARRGADDMKTRKVCIVGLDSYGMLSGDGVRKLHRRRGRAARVAGARLARSRPRRVDDRARRRPGCAA